MSDVCIESLLHAESPAGQKLGATMLISRTYGLPPQLPNPSSFILGACLYFSMDILQKQGSGRQ